MNKLPASLGIVWLATIVSAFGQCLSWENPIINCPSIPCRPSRRAGHAMAFDSDTANVILFGGESANTPQNDTWVYSLTNNSASWARVLVMGPSPPPMSEAAMVYDSARKRCILFGGVGKDRYYDQTWLFEYKGNFTGVWTQLNPSSHPSARAGHAMVFDTNRNVAVLFGGENLTECGFCFQQYNDTWEWDGNNWAERTPSTKPGRRVRHAMAWDSQRGVTVLFGGTVPTGDPFDYDEFSDTWEWNGVDWLQTANPPLEFGRQQHAMAFDSRRGKVVMFGGTRKGHQTLGDDTDEYSGPAGWNSLIASGPPPRARHAMVYDSIHGKMVLFGGASGDTQYDDTWELIDHGPEFTRQPQDTNGPACGEVSFSAAVTGVGALQYQWRKDGFDLFEGSRFVGVNSPTLRITGLQFADEGVYQLAVTSACGESTSAGATLRVNAPWTHHIVNSPQPRTANAMAYDEARGITVMFGGFNSSGAPSRETWEWNGHSWRLRAVSGPAPRWGHGMVYDPERRRVLLFGGNRNRGVDPADFLGDTWEWDGRAWNLLATNGPSPRASFALAYDSVVRRTVLYGGQNGVGGGGQWLYDTWEFNSAAAQWVPVLRGWPAGFSLSTWPPKMAFDTRRGKRVLIDLYTVGIVFADFRLFEWDGVNWLRVTPLPDPKLRTGRTPDAVHDFGIAFDSTRNLVVINNGADPGNFFPRVTWGYDGTYWHRLDAGPGPEGYAGGACAYDTQRRALVQFGGGNNVNGYWGETWESVQADRLQVIRGPEAETAPFGSLQLSVTVRGQPPYLFQWRKNGIPLSDGGSISGANSAVLTLFNPETARYDVVVSGPCGQTTSDVIVAPLPGGTIVNPGGTRLTLSQEQSQWKLRWPDPTAQLFSAPQVTGTWSQVHGAVSPHPISTSQPQQYFRLQGGSGCAGVPDGLVSWWRAEGNAADQTAANSGSLNGGLGFAPGLVGQAFNFTNDGQGVSIPASASLNVGTNAGFTIEGWINPVDATTPYPLMEWWGADGFELVAGVHFWVSGAYAGAGGPGALYFSLDGRGDPAAVVATPPGIVASNTWQHVAAVYRASDPVFPSVTLYLDGVVVASQSMLPTTKARTQFPVYLGMRPGRNYFRGLLDEFALFNRALSALEIQSIHRARAAGMCLPP